MSSTRLLVISDVRGEEARHIGDEAMLEANLATFRRLIPEVAFTLVCCDPGWAAARYGVDAVAFFDFPSDPSKGSERKALLDNLLVAARSRGRGGAVLNAKLEGASEALFHADGLVVSGGGNLSSTWPDLLYERVALLNLARIFGKPAVVLGQTIGPALDSDDHYLLADALSSARFVGVRELPSAALALELGVTPARIWYQSDDALVFEENAESMTVSRPIDARAGTSSIAVTLDPQFRAQGEAAFTALVSQLRTLSKTTRASLILVPHVFGNESAAGQSDLCEARLLAERLALSATIVAAGADVNQARKIVSDSALVISSRYHPIVFALGAGVPAIGIFGDEYCRIKLQGALAHGRLERWAVTYDGVTRGELLTKALELWRIRAEVRSKLELQSKVWREERRERWVAVLRALDPAATLPQVGGDIMFGRPIHDVAHALVSALEARRQWWQLERQSLIVRCNELERSLENKIGIREVVRRYAAAVLSKIGSIRL